MPKQILKRAISLGEVGEAAYAQIAEKALLHGTASSLAGAIRHAFWHWRTLSPEQQQDYVSWGRPARRGRPPAGATKEATVIRTVALGWQVWEDSDAICKAFKVGPSQAARAALVALADLPTPELKRACSLTSYANLPRAVLVRCQGCAREYAFRRCRSGRACSEALVDYERGQENCAMCQNRRTGLDTGLELKPGAVMRKREAQVRCLACGLWLGLPAGFPRAKKSKAA